VLEILLEVIPLILDNKASPEYAQAQQAQMALRAQMALQESLQFHSQYLAQVLLYLLTPKEQLQAMQELLDKQVYIVVT
jgi:hypothetical protein